MEEEIHNFLTINQIEFEMCSSLSIFNVYYLPQHKLYLHLITLQKFQELALSKDHFQKLSDTINAKGERIIHLWEDVWLNQKDLVQSRILAMIGSSIRLNARHCYIERIDMPMAERFLTKNHLQGSAKAKFRYGLFLKPQYLEKYLGFSIYDEVESLDGVDLRTSFKQPSEHNPISLLAVALFSGGRLMKYGERTGERSFELIRFASLRGYSVMGGMDKLLKAFSGEHNPDDIMTYADRDWSDGRSYEILGFERIEITESQTFLLDNQKFKRYSGKENFENYTNIFNAGSIKYIKKIL